MRHTIWNDHTLLGEVDLTPGRFVASRLRATPAYRSVAEIVQSSTRAFLRMGLFYALEPSVQTSAEARESFQAIERAARLRLALANAHGQIVATHFINLLASVSDDGVVVLLSLDEAAAGGAGAELPRDLVPSFSRAPAV